VVLKRRSDFINLEYLQFYLPKSGALPIDVDITLPKDVGMNEIGGVTALLREHASRFRYFDLHVQFYEELEVFISSIGDSKPAPFLEELVLQVEQPTGYSNASEFLSLPTAFTPSPHLDYISLSGCPFPKKFPPTITAMTFNHIDTLNNIISCFESTPSLQDLTFYGCDDPSSLSHISSQFEDPHIVSLPHLHTADISIPGYGVYLLRVIDAPDLTAIHLDGSSVHNFYEDGEGWDADVSALFSTTIRHLSAHSRNLRHMTLEYTKFNSRLEDYALILSGAGFPQLEQLELCETDINDEALLAAGNSGGSSSLKDLTLWQCRHVRGCGLLGFMHGRRSDFRLSLYHCEHVQQKDIVLLSAVVKVHYVQ